MLSLLLLCRYMGRKPNIEFKELLYRAGNARYLPAMAVYTTSEVPEGALGIKGPPLALA